MNQQHIIESRLPQILLVDDDPTVILSLQKVLGGFADCHFANNGKRALALVQRTSPSLILLDIQMPEMDGLQVCEILKANPETAHIPVLFITSKVDTNIEERVFAAGAVDYIPKPLNPTVVCARVQTHLAYQRALAALSSQAFNDVLTGLNNRRRFNEQLELEWVRALRNKLPLSLLMIDIDEFKIYNDHFGHLGGDAAIEGVADALRKSTKRPADFPARYGGEEFSLILPETDAEGAQAMAESVLKSVEELHLAQAPACARPYLTISVGYSTLLPAQGDSSGLQANALIQAADTALYQSKKNGRNRSSYQPLLPQGGSLGML